MEDGPTQANSRVTGFAKMEEVGDATTQSQGPTTEEEPTFSSAEPDSTDSLVLATMNPAAAGAAKSSRSNHHNPNLSHNPCALTAGGKATAAATTPSKPAVHPSK